MDIIKYILIYLAFFVIIYLVYYFFSVRPIISNYNKKQKGKKIKKEKELPTEVRLLQSFYGVDLEKVGIIRTLRIVNFVNAFFLSLLVMVVLPFNEVWLKILILFILILPSIWAVYYFLAKFLKHLERKGRK